MPTGEHTYVSSVSKYVERAVETDLTISQIAASHVRFFPLFFALLPHSLLNKADLV